MKYHMDALIESAVPECHDFKSPCDARPRPLSVWDSANRPLWWPELELVRDDEWLIVRVALGGITKNDIKVFVDDGGLVVEGERKNVTEENRIDRSARAPRFAKFRRPIPLTDEVRPEDVTAVIKGGVLELRLLRPATAWPRQPRRVPITVSEEQ